MYLQELTINGFKSFAKKSELEFSTPITAIVGPNGSGKSNAAEAFRFVLGEQSVKSLRGKRGEDLIWGGSDAVTRGNRASVSVLFDNRQRGLDLDFDEVTIERIVHRDGQNEYKLNGSAVRLKDIHELLAGAHIGATGHHIISQGEADRVLSAGPRERREMIEDALGLKVYQLKKAEATKKLDKTHTNIAQTESLRREAAPHLRYLKKQVERAERALQVKAELTTAYAAYLKREDLYLAARVDQLQAEKGPVVRELTTVQDQIATLRSQLQSDEQSAMQVSLQQAEVEMRETSTALREAERSLSTHEGQIAYVKRRIENAIKESEKTPPEELIPQSKIQSLVQDITQAAKRALEKSDSALIARTLQDVVRQLTVFVEREQPVVADTTEQDKRALAELEQTLDERIAARDTALKTHQKAEQTYTSLQQQVSQESTDQHEAERSLFQALDQERQLTQTQSLLETELQVLERDRSAFKQELQEAVTLIGRGAMEYTRFELLDDAGNSLSAADLLEEDRSVQRDRQRDLEKLKIRLEELGVGGTDDLLQEYKEAQERDAFLSGELEDLKASVQNLERLISDMDAELQQQFEAGIDKISVEFGRFFSLMFGGGSASLKSLKLPTRGDDDTEDSVIEIGVELEVALPNKRVKGLDMLSGGERALTSIALIFAMSQVNPPPFIILDETDAALDEANSRRYGDMIEALAQKSQLILITHNRETMSRAGILYGVTMGSDGVSKVLSVKFDQATEHAK